MDSAKRLLLRNLNPDDEDEDPSPFEAAPSVAANKIARFEGVKKKSKFELAKEAEENKARQEAEDAAKAYRAFVEEFGGEEETGPSTGRRPAVGTQRAPHKGFVKAGGGEKYNPLADLPPPSAFPPASTASTSSSFSASAPPFVPTGPRGAAPPPSAPTGPKASFSRRPAAASFMGDDDEPSPSTKAAGPPGARKKREGDNFLEQLKRDQAAREERLKQKAGWTGSSVTALAAREHAPILTNSASNTGYHPLDSADPLTTNIHVGGLPQNVTENSLGELFAQFGPVGSVKIMWPRLDHHSAAGGTAGRKLGGFVAFMRRPDAERAAKEMDGAEWGDGVLRTGWGKAVPIPTRAMYEPQPDSSYHRDRPGSSSSRHHRRSPSPSSTRRSSPRRSLSPNLDPHEFLSSHKSSKRPRSRSRSRSPGREDKRDWPELEEGVDEKFLETVAKKVRENGRAFEEVLRERERGNERFAFLKREELPSFHFFRMLVDSSYSPPLSTSFADEGPSTLYSSDSSEDSETERLGKGKLGKLAQKRFEAMLRGLTSSRERIARGMAFALEHADCAAVIADLLTSSLTIPSTPIPRKLARLHLVSDILFNAAASVPNAWTYRSVFETRLPAVFDHFGDVYLSFPGRLKAEQWRGMVEKVVDVWANDWMLFPPQTIEDFKRRLVGVDVVDEDPSALPEMDVDPSAPSTFSHPSPTSASPVPPALPSAPIAAAAEPEQPKPAFKSAFKAAAFAPAAAAEAEPEIEAEEEDVDGAAVEMDAEEEDVDGEDFDLDGAPVGGPEADVDGEEVDADGAPVSMEAEEEDVDGAPLPSGPPSGKEEDVDGAPLLPQAAVEGERKEPETIVLEEEDVDGEEAMEMGSDDDIFG
ncbi:hypothetical protein JCM8547_006246 [Rhodosporidiobolus lusitaniae]